MITKTLKPTALFLVILTLFSCKRIEKESIIKSKHPLFNNLLSDLSDGYGEGLKWINKPKSFTTANGSLRVIVEKGTDFFNSPEDKTITSTAPLLFKQIEGDFVATALLKPDFSSMWNAVAVMVHIDNANWIKFAFENSDATGRSIVSVVTREVSDDANGAILNDQDQVWLKVIRKEQVYSMLWSLDGKVYKMARISSLPVVDTVKIGIEFQCPVGESATHEVTFFGIEKMTVNDLRKGE